MRLPKPLRNPSLVIGGLIIVTLISLALFAPWLATHPVEKLDMANRFSYPSLEHLLGTDNLGRDLWSRLIYGARISLSIGLLSVTVAAVIGTSVGLAAGYFGGWVDMLLMRITDVFLGFPAVVLTLAIVAVLGPGVINISAAIIAVTWTEYARVVRATTLVLREQNYVQAARALGASAPRILFGEILPNTLGPIVVLASLGLGTAVIIESAMSFLGFGLPPPTPTWGWTLSYGTRFIRDEPWLSIISGATIMITVLGFNLLGDGLRDILDPRQLTRVGAKK
ncbi:MAG TPA: ABC transporter permease [Devosia sp.]|jgi:peptide/nickel transport system permease protein|uniref:ABC transporter permease n=1 Tax=Devosia sp. TaxID=1871048 RepID=UPI002DDD298D|nr:ABC transporter permease [Devosia sp.]HEV2517026.1 ABC transporter permease [Devosia sp.]